MWTSWKGTRARRARAASRSPSIHSRMRRSVTIKSRNIEMQGEAYVRHNTISLVRKVACKFSIRGTSLSLKGRGLRPEVPSYS